MLRQLSSSCWRSPVAGKNNLLNICFLGSQGNNQNKVQKQPRLTTVPWRQMSTAQRRLKPETGFFSDVLVTCTVWLPEPLTPEESTAREAEAHCNSVEDTTTVFCCWFDWKTARGRGYRPVHPKSDHLSVIKAVLWSFSSLTAASPVKCMVLLNQLFLIPTSHMYNFMRASWTAVTPSKDKHTSIKSTSSVVPPVGVRIGDRVKTGNKTVNIMQFFGRIFKNHFRTYCTVEKEKAPQSFPWHQLSDSHEAAVSLCSALLPCWWQHVLIQGTSLFV